MSQPALIAEPNPPADEGLVAKTCLNCEAPVAGNFCSACGQSTNVHMPSLREFVRELIDHHIAFDGTFLASLRRLLLSPGGLTLDFYAGKRARYVAPLRLYLTLNVLFFIVLQLSQALGGADVEEPSQPTKIATLDASDSADQAALVALANDPSLSIGERSAVLTKLATLKASQRGRIAAPGATAGDDADADPDEKSASDPASTHPAATPEAIAAEKAEAKAAADRRTTKIEDAILPAWVDKHAPGVRRRLTALSQASLDDKRKHLAENMVHYAPYTLLLMLPVCAMLLQISFVGRRRRYTEHLVAALHGHTFLFVVLLLASLPLGGVLQLVLWSAALVHMVLALRRIYGSSWFGLTFRLPLLAGMYGVALCFATLFALIVSVLT
jgi:hypothetical protein